MAILDRIRSFIGSLRGKPSQKTLPTPLHAKAASERALGASLDGLAPEARAYITDVEYTRLFLGHGEGQDHAARTRLGLFAAAHKCTPQGAPSEDRIYFTKKSDLRTPTPAN